RASAAGGPIAEDAGFWHAVTLARLGRSGVARDAWAAFLQRYPSSARAGEAPRALGWLQLGAGAGGPAAAPLPASPRGAAAAERVRTSARSGMDAVARASLGH